MEFLAGGVSACFLLSAALIGSSVSAATFGGSGIGAADGNGVIKLSGSGVTWSLHGSVPVGVTLSGSTISFSGP